jgi:uncharacterized membrane protein
MTATIEQSRRQAEPAFERRREGYSHGSASQPGGNGSGLSRAMGWFSIGLGLAQVAAPRRMARLIGIDDTNSARNTLVAIGLRELMTGTGILARPQASAWLWARLGGDLIDLALLGRALGSADSDRNRATLATAAVLGAMLADWTAARQVSGSNGGSATAAPGARKRGVHVVVPITINRRRDEIYHFWRNFENLPRFMEHLESVRTTGERRSHWKAKAPLGSSVEWDAEIIEDRPSELIAWQSLPEADIPNTGSVRFRDAAGGRGTEVVVELNYQPPGGKMGALLAKLFGEEPEQQVKSDLRRLKQVLEIGEVVHSDASIHRGPHPARPPEDWRESGKAGK